MVEEEFIRKSPKDPTDWAHDEISPGEGTRSNDNLIPKLEGHYSEGNDEDDFEDDERPERVDLEHLTEDRIHQHSNDEAKD